MAFQPSTILGMVNLNYIIAINYSTSTQIRNDLNAFGFQACQKSAVPQSHHRDKQRYGYRIGKSAHYLHRPRTNQAPYTADAISDIARPLQDCAKRFDRHKAIVSSMTGYAANVSGILDTASPNNSIWMKLGTPTINGKPFIWSGSQWSNQLLKGVPDRVDGNFQLLRSYIK